jgi:hypothetical protein
MGIAFERQYKLSSAPSIPGKFSGSCVVRVIRTKYNRAAIKIIFVLLKIKWIVLLFIRT